MSQKQDIVVEYNGLEFSTPMMVQYVELKEKYPDCLIFFRLGDFYELFLEDAQIGAKVLGITLTSRSRGKDGRIPMAGVPYHAVDNYLSKLVKEGHKVAIAEQLSDPSVGDLVQRDIVRIVTPGTLLDEKVLDSKQNNYVAALQIETKSVGFSFADVTTGTFHTSQFGYENLEKVLADQFTKFSPSECILPEESYNNPVHLKAIKNVSDVNIYPFSTWNNVANSSSNAGKFLKDHFNIKSLDVFSMADSDSSVKSSAALLAYLKETQKDQVSHVKKISNFASSEFVHLDRSTIFNLELFRTIRDGGKKGSLVDMLDRTSTPMGARLLRDWIIKPLVNKSKLEARFDFIDELINKFQIRRSLIEDLSKMNDIERILSRVSLGVGNARDLLNIRDTLNLCLKIKSNLDLLSVPIAKELGSQISSDLDTVSKIITKAITPDPPIDLKIGGLINAGVSKELDELKGSISNSTDWLAKLEEVERKATGISTLRVGFNKVFGYYIEVTKSNSPLVPDRYVRKQTLVNAERYITNELKQHEETVLGAQDEINDLEHRLYLQIVNKVLEYTDLIQSAASAIAQIDVLQNFAHLAQSRSYNRPTFNTSGEINIIEGKHPVVSELLTDREFVPNDTTLNHTDTQMVILTGPNMAGKSVYIRQVALISLMAQIGCYVPAKSANLSLVDKIFVRSGASDFITSGLSTFMVEMVETANILHNATANSLVILDEIGRGTTTYDGLSIAWSVVEYLVEKSGPGCKTLFATHYHELQELASENSLIKNYQVAVKQDSEVDEPVFIYRVLPGAAMHSYGINVAKLAGLPESVTDRAKDILQGLEAAGSFEKEFGLSDTISTPQPKKEEVSNKALELEKKLAHIDLNSLTPLDALNILSELKK